MDAGLRSLIVDVAAQHPHAGPQEVADYVAIATSAADVDRWYRELLVQAVRTVTNQQRRDTAPPAPKPMPKDRPTPAPSTKLQERRSWWQNTLDTRVHVGGGVEKTIATCTVDDLEFCIKERSVAIERIDHQIDNFRQLVSLLDKHDVDTVAQLPEQTQWKRVSR